MLLKVVLVNPIRCLINQEVLTQVQGAESFRPTPIKNFRNEERKDWKVHHRCIASYPRKTNTQRNHEL
ncbi:hypothetical protein RGQ30_00040 [Limnobacter thiooxidans]|uniref:Uncharacterized protein n=1 Tax=Limnobacter thiooxidans TaxID=131080 RepID=A0AA86IZ30_9BURK|nr:hypothetical protein RGQ30_00040 [Limnobacter thiooxidans]